MTEPQDRALSSYRVKYHVRGRKRHAPVMKEFANLQEIFQTMAESLPGFAQRNPWICFDSATRTVVVGIDPERQSIAAVCTN